MRFLDQELIDKYEKLPKSGKSILIQAANSELGYFAPTNWVNRMTTRKGQPTPVQYDWLKAKIEELYSYYNPLATTLES